MISPTLPWRVRYEPGVPEDIPTPHEAFPSLLATAAADAPGYPALVYYGRRTSYAELHKAVERAATSCLRDGLRSGEAVLLALPNGPQAVIASLGVLGAGGQLVPMPPSSEPGLVARRIAETGARIAFLTPGIAAGLEPEVAAPRTIVVDESEGLPLSLRLLQRGLRGTGPRPRASIDWHGWLAKSAEADLPELDPEAPALLVFEPEDPERPPSRFAHRHLVAGATQLRVWLTDARPGDDAWLLLAPVIGPFGLTAGLGTAIALRSRLLLLPSAAPDDVADALRFLHPSYVVTSGRAVVSLVARPELARMDLRSVRAWIASEDVGPATAAAFEAATGLALCQGFAPPGVAGLATCNPINGRRAPGSVGLPLPGIDVRLDGPAGGGLELAGPNVAAEGWLPASRRARADAAGYLYIGGARP